jgi:hypothetical protein
MHGKVRNALNNLVGNHKRKRPLGEPMYRWDDNIRMDHRDIMWEGMDWIQLT